MVTPKGVATVQEALDIEKKLTLGYWKLSVNGYNLCPGGPWVKAGE